MRHSRTHRHAAIGTVAILAMVMATLATVGAFAKPNTAFACPSIAGTSSVANCPNYTWPYGHSWYVTNVSNNACTISGASKTAMQCLAYNDAQRVNYECANNTSGTDFLTVLDFGRPGETSSGYSLFSSSIGWQTYGAIENYAEQYADAWYSYTSSCPRLHLVIGTGNDYECYGSVSGCNVYTAGQQFDAAAHVVETHLANEGYSWQVTAWPGEDVEGEWDHWSTTVSFLNGVANQEGTYSTHLNFLDFGDADYGQCDQLVSPYDCSQPWSQQNIYDASWGIGWDVPVPETYTGWLTQQWLNVYNSGSVNKYAGNIQFYGNMAECSEADTLPTNTCWQSGNGQCEWSPELGYNNLSADVGQTNITYTTNIEWQGAAPSGNNGCP